MVKLQARLSRPIVTNRVAWSVGLSVCLSATLVSPAKMAELIKMPFGLRTWVSQRKHILDGGLDHSIKRGNFQGERAAHCKV